MSNKTSDNNVANIEEDVKILNNFCEYEDAVVLTDYALTLVQEAIEHILAELNFLLEGQAKEEFSPVLQEVLSLIKEQSAELLQKNAEIEKKDRIMGKMIDNIMTHYQVKTIRKMCCPTCKIGERACTYSGIHRNCIKQYFENKVNSSEQN